MHLGFLLYISPCLALGHRMDPPSESDLIAIPSSRGWVYASSQATLLVLLTILVSIFYERGNEGDAALISIASYTLTPWACVRNHNKVEDETLCVPAVQPRTNASSTDCILESNHHFYFYSANISKERPSTSLCSLIGETPLYEREAKNLFSVMGVPFLLLSAQVISTAFSLNYIRKSKNQGSNMYKTLKKMTLFILAVFSIAFLFIQITWKIPGNNLLLVELVAWLSLFLLATLHASYFAENAVRQILTLRLLETAITIPLFTSAVLAAAGNTNTNDLSLAFFAVLFANSFLLLLDMDKKTYHDHHYVLQGSHGVLFFNAWLCLIPFLVQCASTLQQANSFSSYKDWSRIAVIVLLVFELGYALGITLSNWFSYSETGRRCARFLLATFCAQNAQCTDWLERFMDGLCLVCHSGIILCVMGGAFLVFPAKEKGHP